MVLDLNNKAVEVEVLEVNIGEATYKIPLGGNMTMKQVNAIQNMSNVDDVFEMLKRYIPEEVLEELTITQITTIIKAWSDATRESAGLSMGESKALRSSSESIARQ